jgi:hypothetical protein
VIARYLDRDIPTFITGRDGAIVVRISADGRWDVGP